MDHFAHCPFCDWKGTVNHAFLGQAKLEMYRHFDERPVCGDKFEKQTKGLVNDA